MIELIASSGDGAGLAFGAFPISEVQNYLKFV